MSAVSRNLEAEAAQLMREIPPALIQKTFKIFSDGPKTLIGPLESTSLPDSPLRTVIWLHFQFCLHKLELPETFENFLFSLPGISLVRRIDKPEYVGLPSRKASHKQCIDEVLEGTDFYSSCLKSVKAYDELRRLAFLDGKPVELMREVDYEPVSEAQVGDLVVYFNNIKERGNVPDPTYSPVKRPAHYAKVVAVGEEGPLIESRLGSGHIMRHPLDGIPYFYGNSYLLYRKK